MMRYVGSSANLHHYVGDDGVSMVICSQVAIKRTPNGSLTRGPISRDKYHATIYAKGVGEVAEGQFPARPRDGVRAPLPTARQVARMYRALAA